MRLPILSILPRRAATHIAVSSMKWRLLCSSASRAPEGFGFRNWYDAMFGNIKIDVFAPTSLFFIKFQNKEEVKALDSWSVLTDAGGGGISTASFSLERCSNIDAVGDDETSSKEETPDIFEVEALYQLPPVFKYYGRFFGSVSPIPVDALWNRGGDPNRFGYCALVSPKVQNPFPTQNFNVVEIRIRTSLRSFLLNFWPEEQSTSRFQSLVRVPEGTKWHTIAIPYDAFQLTSRGRIRDIDWGLAEDSVYGVTITVRSGDAIPWGDNINIISTQEFHFDLQWIRFVRRSQAVAEELSQTLLRVSAKEEYVEYLLQWKQRVDILLADDIVENSSDVAGFSLDQLLEIESPEDVQDIRTQIEHEGVAKPSSASWYNLTDLELVKVEEQVGIRNFAVLCDENEGNNKE